MKRTESDTFQVGAFLKTVTSEKTTEEFLEGEVLYSQGDLADSVFYILKGKVRLTVVSPQGKEAIVGILEAGAFVGEGCLSTRTHRMATAVALEDSQIVRLGKNAMEKALNAQPHFSTCFISYLLSRSIRIEEDLVDQLFNSSEKRLARALLLLANFDKDRKVETVIPRVSQEMLAEMIGTTRSRVSFFMNKFRKQGFIEYNSQLKVHNSLLNVILHD